MSGLSSVARSVSAAEMYDVFQAIGTGTSPAGGAPAVSHIPRSSRTMSPAHGQCRCALLIVLLAAATVCGSIVPLSSLSEADRSLTALGQRPGPLLVFVFDSRCVLLQYLSAPHLHLQSSQSFPHAFTPLTTVPFHVESSVRAALKRRPRPSWCSPRQCATCRHRPLGLPVPVAAA